MIYKIQTRTPLETVKAQIQDKAKTLGFGILNSYDFQKILHNKGFTLNTQITVYEICNPPAANMALNAIEVDDDFKQHMSEIFNNIRALMNAL